MKNIGEERGVRGRSSQRTTSWQRAARGENEDVGHPPISALPLSFRRFHLFIFKGVLWWRGEKAEVNDDPNVQTERWATEDTV